MKKNKQIKTQYVFSKNNQVLIKQNEHEDIWFPINFHWMPLLDLREQMNA